MFILKIILCAFLAGFGKAARDTIAHHWEISIFKNIKFTRIRNWLKSDYKNRPGHPFWFLWDAWHFSDTLSYIALIPIIRWASDWHEIAIAIGIFYVIFNLFYSEILINRKIEVRDDY